jgi:hypothetical protein
VFALPLPRVYLATFVFTVVGAGAILFAWHGFRKDNILYFMVTTILVYVALVFLQNLQSYYKFHIAAAIQPRYLLPILPVVFTLVIASFAQIIQSRIIRTCVVVLFFVFYIQGAGVITSIVQSQDDWYWPHQKIINADKKLKSIIDPLVPS